MLDRLVIGGGPAGLAAATYLALFHPDFLVVDDGQSRAKRIPVARNHATFSEGIGGTRLLERMGDQARRYEEFKVAAPRPGAVMEERPGHSSGLGTSSPWTNARTVRTATAATIRLAKARAVAAASCGARPGNSKA